MKERFNPAEFKPGVYRHYKGNYYIALHIARHHDNPDDTRDADGNPVHWGDFYVVYYCPEQKTLNVREWDTTNKDSWCDSVDMGNGVYLPRFEYVGPAL